LRGWHREKVGTTPGAASAVVPAPDSSALQSGA
jgi:hypothetical protein